MDQQITGKFIPPQRSTLAGLSRDEKNEYYAVTIGREPRDVYEFWRDFANLRYFMKDISSIAVLSPTKSHWTAQLKSGFKAEWDAEITEDIQGEKISWRSTRDSEVEVSGTVLFVRATHNRGTIVRLALSYHVPGGKLTEFATMFTGESPELLILTNLHRMKSYLETGEVPTIAGQPNGKDENKKQYTRH